MPTSQGQARLKPEAQGSVQTDLPHRPEGPEYLKPPLKLNWTGAVRTGTRNVEVAGYFKPRCQMPALMPLS